MALARLLLLTVTLILASRSFAFASPTETLRPVQGQPTTSIKVTGGTFAASEAVDVYFDTTDEMLIAADRSGKFSVGGLIVPANTLPGLHWITAVGRTTGKACRAQFMVRTDWPQFGWGPHGKRNNLNENAINAGNVGSLKKLWSISTGGAASSPVIADGNVYVSSKDGPVAIDQATGAIKWTSGIGQYASAPTVLNKLVFSWTDFDAFYETEMAFDTTTGALVWSNVLRQGTVRFPHATANGVLYVSEDLAIHALDPSTGKILWMAQNGSANGGSTPTVADGIVYVNSLYSAQTKILAFDAKTGKAIWATQVADLVSTPVVASGVVYAVTWAVGRGSKICALNAKTGAVIWELGSPATHSFAIANGILYLSGDDGRLYAIRARSGKLVWSSVPIGAALAPAVANGVVYAGGSSITALDESTGSILWTSPSGGTISSPVVADGMVVAGSTDGNVYAYALDGGKSAVYHQSAAPPPYSSLHPDFGLSPVQGN